jgi:hypothetical protein
MIATVTFTLFAVAFALPGLVTVLMGGGSTDIQVS